LPKKTRMTDRGRDLVREGLLLAALAGQALLLVALMTYGADQAAHEERVGVVGHYVADALYGAFGIVSYVLVILGLYTSVIALVRHKVTAPLLRMVGLLLILVGSCTLLFQFWDFGSPRTAATGLAGGKLGEVLFDFLRSPFGAIGTFVLAVSLVCSGFAFATDWLVYEMLYDGTRRATHMIAFFKRLWPQPSLAGVGVAAAPKASPKAKAPRAKPKNKKKPAPAEEPTPEPTPEPPVVVTTVPDPEDTNEWDISPAGESSLQDEPLPDELSFDDPQIVVPTELLDRLAPPAEAAPGDEDRSEDEPQADASESEVESEPEHFEEPELPSFEISLSEPEPQEPQEVRFDVPRGEGEYELPSPQLLDHAKPRNLTLLEKAIQHNAEVLQRTLSEFKVEGRVVGYQQGPVVTMLEVSLAPGTKVTKIHSLADDLAMALKAESVRIVAPIPGKSTVGVEIPNPEREDVRLPNLLSHEGFRNGEYAIPLFLGVAADGGAIVTDLAHMPHVLLAGATGSGKSVCINTIILSVLLTRTPDQVKMILVDPKQVELSFFADIPHLLAPVVTDMKRAAPVLEWVVERMEERYNLLRRFEVRNIGTYNELGEAAIKQRAEELDCEDEVIPIRLPYIVIVVDELADLMLTGGKDIEKLITRLAQKSRAVGIHIILATQRPSTDVITGLIKANMPTRIAFKVASKVDSRVVLDQNGADKLLGAGDMLYLPPRSSALLRAQGTFVSDKEVKRVVTFLKQRYEQEFNEDLVRVGTAALLSDAEKDVLYDEAAKVVLHSQRGSASLLQRELGIGYTRASRLLDQMRKEGIVGAYKGSKASDVQMTLEQYEQRIASAQDQDN